MEKFIIRGGKPLKGEIKVTGAKNVALKVLVAACFTNEEVVIRNVPLISDFFVMTDIIKELGGEVLIVDHVVRVKMKEFKKTKISLEKAAEIRTSVMFLAPLLARVGKATIPNPGGCRIGARPIDRIIEGLKRIGVDIRYDSKDGYFHAHTKRLKGNNYKFEKNSHMGTEVLILASCLAKGKTVLENAATEPEIDDLIDVLNNMGAKIKRIKDRTIQIEGVEKLRSSDIIIGPDRNEIVTLAIAAATTGGDVFIRDVDTKGIEEFLTVFEKVGGGFEKINNGLRFFAKSELKAINIRTSPYPGFMTDWQGPFALLMTQAKGESIIHETIYENRFGYVEELKKMGAHIQFFNPKVENPHRFYNFNVSDDKQEYFHAIKIFGPTKLHNAVVSISDLRAGATLVLAALIAKGENIIFGVKHLDRGYEAFDKRLRNLGADIRRVNHE